MKTSKEQTCFCHSRDIALGTPWLPAESFHLPLKYLVQPLIHSCCHPKSVYFCPRQIGRNVLMSLAWTPTSQVRFRVCLGPETLAVPLAEGDGHPGTTPPPAPLRKEKCMKMKQLNNKPLHTPSVPGCGSSVASEMQNT